MVYDRVLVDNGRQKLNIDGERHRSIRVLDLNRIRTIVGMDMIELRDIIKF